jgi:ribosomal protein L40E
MARVIMELKSALEKGTTIKDVTGGATSTSSAPQMAGFGVGSFISSGGIVGKEQTIPTLRKEDVSLASTTMPSKTCKECGTVLPIKASFCSKCGKAQENT